MIWQYLKIGVFVVVYLISMAVVILTADVDFAEARWKFWVAFVLGLVPGVNSCLALWIVFWKWL